MQKSALFKKIIVPIVAMILITILTGIFSILCIKQFKEGFIFEKATIVISTTVLMEIVLLIVMIVCLFLKIEAAHKSIFTLFVLAAVSLIGLYILQKTGIYETINSKVKLQEMIQSFGVWPPFIYVGLQFLQVCILPIPSVITIGAGVAMFGIFKTILFSFIGIMLGSLVAFFIGRFLGYKTVAWIVGKESLDKWLKKIEGKDKILLTAMFILPLFPDDLLCFVAGLTSMSLLFYTVMQVVTRGITVAVTCFALNGSIIPYNTWWGLLIWGIIFAIVIVAIIIIWRKGNAIEQYIAKKFGKSKKSNSREDKHAEKNEKNMQTLNEKKDS